MVFFIQESKLISFDSRLVRVLGGPLLSRGVGGNAISSAGGLITLWNEELFKVKELVRLKNEMIFCNVYAPNVEAKRRLLWDFLVGSQATFQMPWCIDRDFNSILDPSEQRGRGVYFKEAIKSFNEFILRARVVDLLMQGRVFTWLNFREKGS